MCCILSLKATPHAECSFWSFKISDQNCKVCPGVWPRSGTLTSPFLQPLTMCLCSPADMDSQTRHMALSSLFMEVLMMMNNATIPTAEFLRGSVRAWIGQKVHGLVVLPLLTAACQSLASVRHMAETTEACITAYFNEGTRLSLGWSFPGESKAFSERCIFLDPSSERFVC